MPDRKQYGAVYGIVNKVLTKQYESGVKPGFKALSALIETFKQEGNEAYVQDHGFPAAFYQALAMSAAGWFIEEFFGASSAADITDALQTAWKFHREYIGTGTSIDWDKAVSTASVIAKGHPRYTENFALIAMIEIEKQEKGETADGKSVSEKAEEAGTTADSNGTTGARIPAEES